MPTDVTTSQARRVTHLTRETVAKIRRARRRAAAEPARKGPSRNRAAWPSRNRQRGAKR